MQWKGRPMWIYDGENWIEEGVSEREKKTDRSPLPGESEFRPELEIVEIPHTNYNPPPPMP